MRLSQDEIRTAVREYMEKRGVPVPQGTKITWCASRPDNTCISVSELALAIDVHNVELPLAEGPYR